MFSRSSISHSRGYALKFLQPIGVMALLILSGCGSGGGDSTPTPAPPAPPTSPSTGSTCVTGTLVAFNSPTPVTVSGVPAPGVDVNVGGPQACPAANAEALGTANIGASSITAQDTGAQVHRGDSKNVIVFGAGLTGVTNVSISGQPNDFIITNVVNRTATDGTPGVQFQITVSVTAALGARSVVLRASNGDTAVFTGGLEVLP